MGGWIDKMKVKPFHSSSNSQIELKKYQKKKRMLARNLTFIAALFIY